MTNAEFLDNGKFNVVIGYEDLIGNIGSIVRSGFNPETNSYETIDQMEYSYSNGFLTNVNDAGIQEIGARSSSYEFDTSTGNLTSSDVINSIDYNYLNLPNSTNINNLNAPDGVNQTTIDMDYSYDADGTLWKRDIHKKPDVENYYYINGVIYNKGIAESIATTNGRYVFTTNDNQATADLVGFEYVIRDHLGNGRVWFMDKDKDGLIDRTPNENEVVQTKHYYPFGMQMNGPLDEVSAINPENRFTYNEKEFEEDWGMHNYGARFYDPAIARFTTIDPLADKYSNLSSYAYVANNPIKYIDPDGKQIILPSIFTQFGQDLQRDLNIIYGSSLGKRLIRDLDASKTRIIHKDAGRFYFTDIQDVLNSETRGDYPNYWEAKDGIITVEYAQRADVTTSGISAYSFLILAHEYVHARDIDMGILDQLFNQMREEGIDYRPRFDNELAETRALIFTNALRKQLGVDEVRTHYREFRVLQDDGITPIVDYGIDITKDLLITDEIE